MTDNNFNFTNGVSYDVWYEQKRLIDRLEKENKELKKINVILQNRNQQLDGAITETACYRKALEEIWNLVQKVSDADECPYGDFDCNNCDGDNTCPTKVKRLILDIISKAKGEE